MEVRLLPAETIDPVEDNCVALAAEGSGHEIIERFPFLAVPRAARQVQVLEPLRTSSPFSRSTEAISFADFGESVVAFLLT